MSKKTAMDLSKVLRRIERVIGKARIGLDIIDSKYTIRYIDPAWEKVYGDPAGKKCYQYFMGRSSVCPHCGVRRALKTKKITVTEERLVREGNRPIQVTTIPFKDENGEWLVAETNVDISRVWKAEEDLRKAAHDWQKTFDASRDMIMILDPRQNILKANRATSDFLGIPLREIIGRQCYRLVHGTNAPIPTCPVTKTVRSKNSVEGEVFLPQKGVWISVSADPVLDDSGEVREIVHTVRDITERKQAETVLKRDQRELEAIVRERSRELLEAHEELGKSRRLSELGLLAAAVAHELRTPLAAIRTAAYNIDRKCASPAIDSHIENIEKKVLESDHIIKNLLAYSRIKSPIHEDVDPCRILEECIEQSREIFRGYKVSVRKLFSRDRPRTIQVDPVQLREVFNNLLNNAYECFPDKKGTIIIRLWKQGVFFKASFRDNGPGIPAADLQRIFEPFFTTKTKGMGLGLSVCRQIADLHDGKLEAKSGKGKGTITTLTLPVRRGALPGGR